ncbi:hypothetical protein M0812_21852 [Anaeramoeba flamelloides]|uniref:Uncharacterized protein n=1 Tax=Anaeramoeba flamelloides TaxID=1746091 RepID=A0AAV7YVS0_9EUKA|nr:hypothetical protein M0812_21852 [Anaeramoeba flamelloides]
MNFTSVYPTNIPNYFQSKSFECQQDEIIQFNSKLMEEEIDMFSNYGSHANIYEEEEFGEFETFYQKGFDENYLISKIEVDQKETLNTPSFEFGLDSDNFFIPIFNEFEMPNYPQEEANLDGLYLSQNNSKSKITTSNNEINIGAIERNVVKCKVKENTNEPLMAKNKQKNKNPRKRKEPSTITLQTQPNPNKSTKIKSSYNLKSKNKTNGNHLLYRSSVNSKYAIDNNQKMAQKAKIQKKKSENGRDIFKLFLGQLWVISGGSTHKALLPFTNKIAALIGDRMDANTKERNEIKSKCKYLLANTRRTFTEYILEILLGVLSLINSQQKKEKTSIRLRKILLHIKEFQILENKSKQKIKIKKKILKTNFKNQKVFLNINQFTKQKKKKNELKKKAIKKQSRINNHPDSIKQKINKKLEKICKKIFLKPVLMYWFEKRFFPNFTNLFTDESQSRFFKDFLYQLTQSKFILMSWVLAKELLKPNGPLKEYFQLINIDYNYNPLNLYLNNRGKKLKLVKELIVKFGLNNSNYWNTCSSNFLLQNNIQPSNLLDHSPFQETFKSPTINNLFRLQNESVKK